MGEDGKEVRAVDDKAIIDLLFERSEQGLAALEQTYGAAVRRTAANYLRDAQDVEECVNDAFLGVWNSIPPHRPESLAAYVCRIARNLAAKRYHANSAAKRNRAYDAVLDELQECISSSVDVEAEFAAKEISAAIDRFLSALSYLDRFCFVRRYWYADPIEAIADMTKKSRHYVSVRLFRTRNKLYQYLKEEEYLT